MASQASINEDDLDSPGYEYLRSYQNMANLYVKLLALNYEREFCPLYKCPPIHRYYFSIPLSNPNEQRFSFTCLCAWLIKDKCHMNLDLEPEEYEDLDVTLGVIMEALQLITDGDDHDGGSLKRKGNRHAAAINFPQNRLRRGYGPEVIWTLNILADRALEMLLEDAGSFKIRISYKHGAGQEKRSPSASNSITVGQPYVGGGLTTRPLGNYIIDDESLLLNDEDDDDDQGNDDDGNDRRYSRAEDQLRLTATGAVAAAATDVDSHEWYRKVESSRHILESVRFDDDKFSPSRLDDWSENVAHIEEAQKSLECFLERSTPVLETIAQRVDRQLQLIYGREKFLQTNLRLELESFLEIWRKYSAESARNEQLAAQVDSKTDVYESREGKVQQIYAQIEGRKRDLNDGSKLKELKSMINKLKEENRHYDIRIGLLLAVYFKLESETIAKRGDSDEST